MLLAQAFKYPFRGKESLRRILLLTLLQFLPVVGQLMLLGYGLDVVRAIYAGQTDLPSIRWQTALGNGLRFLVAGLGYLLPIFITVGLVLATTLGANKAAASGGFGVVGMLGVLVAIGLPLLVLLLRAVAAKRITSPSVQQAEPKKPGGGLRLLLNGLLPGFMMVLLTVALSTLVSLSGLQTGNPNGLSILLFALFALLIFLIWIVLHIGGVRQAIENRGLLAPIANLKLLLNHRALTGQLLLNLILLCAITFITTTIGLVLLILPGLFAFVLCSLAIWYVFAHYGISSRMFTPGFTPTKNSPLLL